MTPFSEVAVIGAGPYGLSTAAHLRARGVNLRIFGAPMEVWRNHMPRGMLLKSDGFASNLSDPRSVFTLKKFCQEQRLPYDDKRAPVPLETFVRYGLAFQKCVVPELENRTVTSSARKSGGFDVSFSDGETIGTRKVVVAAGISHFAFTPENIAGLPPAFLAHSSVCPKPETFRGRNVTVLGAGASAIDLAALLHEAGACVTVIARTPEIKFHSAPSESSGLWDRVRRPSTGIGPGWRSYLYTHAAHWFHTLPNEVRRRVVKRHLGPAAGWPMKERVLGRIPLWPGRIIQRAEMRGDRVALAVLDARGSVTEHLTDFVISATGYRVGLRRLPFLNDELRSAIRAVDQTPALSTHFQCSVPGLYFIGPAAANSFGPMMRFVFGADFTARRLSGHLTGLSGAEALPLLAAAHCQLQRSQTEVTEEVFNL